MQKARSNCLCLRMSLRKDLRLCNAYAKLWCCTMDQAVLWAVCLESPECLQEGQREVEGAQSQTICAYSWGALVLWRRCFSVSASLVPLSSSLSDTHWVLHPSVLYDGISLAFYCLNDQSILACSLLSGSLELKIPIKPVTLEKICFLLENFANPLPFLGSSV